MKNLYLGTRLRTLLNSTHKPSWSRWASQSSLLRRSSLRIYWPESSAMCSPNCTPICVSPNCKHQVITESIHSSYCNYCLCSILLFIWLFRFLLALFQLSPTPISSSDGEDLLFIPCFLITQGHSLTSLTKKNACNHPEISVCCCCIAPWHVS